MKPQDVKRGWLLSFFIVVNVITILSAVSVLAAEILSMIYHPLTRE